MNFISLAKNKKTVDVEGYEVYANASTSQLFGHYDFHGYTLLKDHWINAVNMFNDYGHAYCCNSTSIVVAGVNPDMLYHNELVEGLNNTPNNTLVFAGGGRRSKNQLGLFSVLPSVEPNCFAAKYPTFIQFVSLWKWIDSHKNQPELLQNDTMDLAINRWCYKNNIQYKILNEEFK